MDCPSIANWERKLLQMQERAQIVREETLDMILAVVLHNTIVIYAVGNTVIAV